MHKEKMGSSIRKISPEFLSELMDITEECYKDDGNCFEFSIDLGRGVKLRYSIGFQFSHE